MTPEDVAAAFDVLASRVRRMSPPLARQPERFYEERSDVAKDIADLARRVSPRDRLTLGVEVDVSDIRRGRIVTTARRLTAVASSCRSGERSLSLSVRNQTRSPERDVKAEA